MDADARQTYRIKVFRLTTTTSSFAVRYRPHAPDAVGRAGTHGNGLYGNGVLASLPAYLIRQLQSVFNAAARLIYRLRSRDNITDQWRSHGGAQGGTRPPQPLSGRVVGIVKIRGVFLSGG